MRRMFLAAKKHTAAVRVPVFLAVLVTVAILCVSLSACNRGNGENAAAERAAASAAFTDGALRAADASWSADLTDEEILSLDDCGGYLLTAEWLTAAGDFLAASPLQTAQIRALADYLASEEGAEAVRDPENHVEALFAAFRNAGFSAYDIENIVYEGLIFLAEESEEICRGAAARIRRMLLAASGAAASSLSAALQSADISADSLAAADTEGAAAAVRSAEKGLKALSGFAYGTGMLFGENGLGGLLDGFTSGALADASDGEIFVYLDSLLKSVRSLGGSMTSEETALVADACASVYSAFERVALPFGLNEFFGGLKYAPFAAEQINLLCTVAESAGKAVYETDADGAYTYRFVKKIKDFVALEKVEYPDDGTAEYVKQVNSFVLYAELAVAAADDLGREYLSGLLEDYREERRADRLIALFYIDFYFANWLKRGNFGEQEQFYADVLNVIVAEGILSALRAAYSAYSVSPTTDNLKRLESNIQPLNNYLGGSFIQTEERYTELWYDNAVETVNGKLLADMIALRDGVLDDFAGNADDFFALKLPLLKEIASFDVASDPESAEFGELVALAGTLIGEK